jgi:hypothetical protein
LSDSTALFQRRRKYSIPVHICAHPELNQYIRQVVDGIKPLLEAGQVDHVSVIIRNKVCVCTDSHTNISVECIPIIRQSHRYAVLIELVLGSSHSNQLKCLFRLFLTTPLV